jgi:dihydrolipoamide dehydrogenase
LAFKEGKMNKYSAVVIGAGPAGYTCAVRLAELGAKVAVVERDFVGGICTNWGCTPSKSMIESAKIARTVRESARYGVHVSDVRIDFKQVAERRDDVIYKSRQEVIDLLKHHQVDIYQGEAEILEPGRLKICAGKLDLDGFHMHYSGEEIEIEAHDIVIATGSQPLIPDFINKDDPYVVSSNRLISIGSLPETLMIVGGGVIGLEFATIFSNLGSKVTIIELLEHVLSGMDPEISDEIARIYTSNGVTILTCEEILGVENGVLKAKSRASGEILEVASQAILIAIGRRPVINKEMFERLGLQYSEKGVWVNDFMQTNLPGIWSVGDTTGKSILAHVGMQQGIICAENIAKDQSGALRAMDYSAIPSVVYSIPEVVGVGTVPKDLTGVSIFKVPFAVNLRARIEAYDEGFVKIWVKDNRVLAAQAIGHNVSEIIQELTNMIAMKTPLNEVAEIIHAHPTYSEITRSILEYALGKAVDFYQ